MKKNNVLIYKSVLLSLILLAMNTARAQVSINTDNSMPDSSAILDIKSSDKGLLYPRMNTAERDSISNPAIGLTIFNLDDKCTDIYDGSSWMKDCPLVLIADSLVNPWTQKSDFTGVSRSHGVGFSIDGKGYMGTGSDSNIERLKDFWEYDPNTDTWTQKAEFGGSAVSSAVSFTINGKGYLGTGFDNGGHSKALWEYDPSTDTWTQKADFGGSARQSAIGFSLNGKGYIGTGYDGSVTKDFWEYDPTIDKWTQKADFPGVGRLDAVAFSINGKGYVGTGVDLSTNLLKDFWEYDPNTDTWTQKADFGGTGRNEAVGFSLNDKGFIGTGYSGNREMDFWEYDPNQDTWAKRADFPGIRRQNAIGFSIDDIGYIGTGYSGSSDIKDFWAYNSSLRTTYQTALTQAGSVANPTLRDIDNDTKVQVEKSPDEDVIHFDVAGREAVIMDDDFPINIISTPNNQHLIKLFAQRDTAAWHIRLQGDSKRDLGFTESDVADHRLVLEAGGHVGVGVENPDTNFHVVGSIKMVDGNQGAGKVLVSDAGGVGRWASANCKAYGDGSAGDVVISSAVDWSANPPMNGNYLFNNLTITASGSLTVPSGTIIMVASAFRNEGTVTVQAGIPGTRFVTHPNGPFPSLEGQTLSHRYAYTPEQLRFITNPKIKGGSNGTMGGFVGPTTIGGDGGGTISIRAGKEIINIGTINAQGGDAAELPEGAEFPGPGGGGGGFVILVSQEILQTGSISVKGGNGADAGNGDNNQGGGGGGGGVIHLIASNANSVGGTMNIAGGMSGSSAGDGLGTSDGGDGGASGGHGGTGGDYIFSSSTTIPPTNGSVGVIIRTQLSDPCNLAFD